MANPNPKGSFLEIGALDGVTFSNSIFYEECLGWQGLLIEGNEVNYNAMVSPGTTGVGRR